MCSFPVLLADVEDLNGMLAGFVIIGFMFVVGAIIAGCVAAELFKRIDRIGARLGIQPGSEVSRLLADAERAIAALRAAQRTQQSDTPSFGPDDRLGQHAAERPPHREAR
jgi:hypothetical protein